MRAPPRAPGPAGFVYLRHSLRSGGSGASVIRVGPAFGATGSAAGLRMAGHASFTTWTRRCCLVVQVTSMR